jgi:hypothetical protein
MSHLTPSWYIIGVDNGKGLFRNLKTTQQMVFGINIEP